MAVVYVSSTYEGLKDHRKAVDLAVSRLGHEVRAMETYVAACDIYVGVFAWRYGVVPEDGNAHGQSITELGQSSVGFPATRCRSPSVGRPAPRNHGGGS